MSKFAPVLLRKNDCSLIALVDKTILRNRRKLSMKPSRLDLFSAFFILILWFLNVSHPIFCFSQSKKTTALLIVADEYNVLHDFDNFQVGGHEVYHHSFTHDPLGNLTIIKVSASNELNNEAIGQSFPSVTHKS